MSEMIRAAIVRVRHESDQQVVGVGFLVDAGKKTILTCAHVINAAIEDSENQVKPRSLISLDFPFLDPDKRLDARVTHFFPKKRDNTDDIALLEILDDLPAEAKAVQLATAETYSGHDFGVYGFPVGFEDNGQYVEGKLQEKLVNRRIQAVGTSNLGYFVERGFSGSPVYDKELDAVVGVMMQVDVEPEKRVAFIASCDSLVNIRSSITCYKIRRVPQVSKQDSISPLLKRHLFVIGSAIGNRFALIGVPGQVDPRPILELCDALSAIDVVGDERVEPITKMRIILESPDKESVEFFTLDNVSAFYGALDQLPMVVEVIYGSSLVDWLRLGKEIYSVATLALINTTEQISIENSQDQILGHAQALETVIARLELPVAITNALKSYLSKVSSGTEGATIYLEANSVALLLYTYLDGV